MLGIFCGLGGAEENAKGGNVFGPVQQCHVVVVPAITMIAVRAFPSLQPLWFIISRRQDWGCARHCCMFVLRLNYIDLWYILGRVRRNRGY